MPAKIEKKPVTSASSRVSSRKAKLPRISTADLEKYAFTALKKWVKEVETHRVLKNRVFHNSAIRDELGFQVDLTVTNAPRMAKLNHQYRGKKEPTDVLSFAADHFFQGQGVLGDLVICAPVVLKQAKEFNHSWKKEIDVLLVHGLLHLLHFDHELGKKEALEMAKWEKKLLGNKTLITRATKGV